jgi:RNA polymerase sigma-54 factor
MTKLIQHGHLRQNLKMTTSMQQSLKMLQMSSLELNELVAIELAKNPFLEDDNTYEEKLVPKDNFTNYSSSSISDPNDDIFANIETSQTLRSHITEQINTSISDHKERLIAYHLLDALQSNGYLNVDSDEIQLTLKCDYSLIEKVIRKLQTFDPAGIFARNLKECLQLQLSEKGLYSHAMSLLIDNLALLANSELKKLEKVCNVNSHDLKNMIYEIQKLNPKPGNSFLSEETGFKIPDVILTIENNIAKIEINYASMPKLRLNHEYYLNIKSGITNKVDKDFANNELYSANNMLKAIEQRAKTIVKVSSAILEEQIEFFTRGIMYLKPLTLVKIAEITNLDESTISRATANKYISTSSGIYELKYFFSSHLSNSKSLENDVSSTKAQEIIKQIILNEDPNNVLSDDDIASELKKFNITIARRTVAKYRERAGCNTSAIRKRQYKLVKQMH